ncbi:hypothetical protein AX16_003259 [Volvariella volvacea WC 439]|nr:hypothetical protein AX16_003259 [Volvariella volvacea WC 439]
MSFADWHSGVTVELSGSQHTGYICMSTVDDLSYTPSAEQHTRDVEQISITGRQSWKTVQGRAEAVWPPQVEAALIEALQVYTPSISRTRKVSGRFPLRNRFIADYIFAKTGKRRSPKQVGSRLQQLRDTCKVLELRKLIDHGRGYPRSKRENSSTPPPESAESDSGSDDFPTQPTFHVDVTLLPQSQNPSPATVWLSSESASQTIELPVLPSGTGFLRTPLPSITFNSPCNIMEHTSFAVYKEGVDGPVHHEETTVHRRRGPKNRYECTLLPQFWESVISDPYSKFTVVQTITLARARQTSHPGTSRHRSVNLQPAGTVTVVYYLDFPTSPSPSAASNRELSPVSTSQKTPAHITAITEQGPHVYAIPQTNFVSTEQTATQQIHMADTQQQDHQWVRYPENPVQWTHHSAAGEESSGTSSYVHTQQPNVAIEYDHEQAKEISPTLTGSYGYDLSLPPLADLSLAEKCSPPVHTHAEASVHYQHHHQSHHQHQQHDTRFASSEMNSWQPDYHQHATLMSPISYTTYAS